MALTKIGILRNFLSTGIDDNANALALTLDTDENATFANGVTASSFAGDGSNLTGLPGGGISYVTKTANYTASNDEGIIADTSGGSFTVTLPASPSAGDQVYIADPANWSTNNLTVARNGSTIEGASEDFTVDIGGIIVGFLYDGSTWQVYPQSGFASYQSLDSVLTIGSTTSQSLTVGELTVSGNLQVDGTTTTINSTTLTVDDKNIVLASGATDAAAADGSGITIDGASATLTYGSTNDAWSFNKDLGIGVANPAQRLDVREEKTGGGVLVQIYNEDNSDTTTQTAGIAMGPDTRGGTARITAVKENASFATNAGRDVALTFSSVLNNSPTERMRIDSAGNVGIGTTDPSTELHVKGAGTVANFEGTGGSGFIQITDSDDATTAFIGVDAGKLKFQTSGSSYSDKVVIDTVGNVGIGTTSPNEKLNVSGNIRVTSGFVSFSGSISTPSEAAALYRPVDNTIAMSTANIERMRIDSSGNVCIGTDTAAAKLHINGTGDLLRLTSTNGSSGGAQIDLMHFTSSPANGDDHGIINFGGYYSGTTQAYGSSIRGAWNDVAAREGQMHFYTRKGSSFTEKMRLDEDGNLLVGTTSTVGTGTEGIQIAQNLIISGRNQTSDQIHHIFKNPNGTVGTIRTLNSATSYVTSSDQRLKENIVDAPAGNINDIRIRSFDWIVDGLHQTYGIVAQELADVAPEAVSQGETEDDMWGVDYSKLVPMMIKEIQDLKARVATLESA